MNKKVIWVIVIIVLLILAIGIIARRGKGGGAGTGGETEISDDLQELNNLMGEIKTSAGSMDALNSNQDISADVSES